MREHNELGDFRRSGKPHYLLMFRSVTSSIYYKELGDILLSDFLEKEQPDKDKVFWLVIEFIQRKLNKLKE